jgi:hypothetical protein
MIIIIYRLFLEPTTLILLDYLLESFSMKDGNPFPIMEPHFNPLEPAPVILLPNALLVFWPKP